MIQPIERFLDTEGKLKQFPSKHSMKLLAFDYLAGKFAYDVEYTEQEVNAILASWHTFGDYFILRRGLVESGWLLRLPNGSKYWKNPDKQMNDADYEESI